MAWAVLVGPHGQKDAIWNTFGRKSGFRQSPAFEPPGYYPLVTTPSLLSPAELRLPVVLQTLRRTFYVQ